MYFCHRHDRDDHDGRDHEINAIGMYNSSNESYQRPVNNFEVLLKFSFIAKKRFFAQSGPR